MKSSVTGEISKLQTVINCPMWEKEEIQGTKGQEKKFMYYPLVYLFLKMIHVPLGNGGEVGMWDERV